MYIYTPTLYTHDHVHTYAHIYTR